MDVGKMKRHDEIKKGLECCRDSKVNGCTECPYFRDKFLDALIPDVIALNHRLDNAIINLAKNIEIIYKQRDAAIEDLRGRCFACAHAKSHDKYPQLNTCPYIKSAVGGNGARACEHWQWHGTQEVKDEQAK